MQKHINANLSRAIPFILLALAFLTTSASAQETTLTIDQIEGSKRVITIYYTTTDPLGISLVPINWAYSIDVGKTWMNIDAAAITHNEPKPPSSRTISWNTTIGANNLANQHHPSVLFRMQVHDPEGGINGSWRRVKSMPTARASLAASVVDGKIYTIGGGAGVRLSTVEVYDPANNTWRSVAKMPTARYNLDTAVVAGKIYAIGGEFDWRTPLPIVEMYDPATDKWQALPPMPAENRRSAFAATVVDGKIYAIGGHNGVGRIPRGNVKLFDPANNTWRQLADMPTARYDLAAAFVDGKIYAIGGDTGIRLSTVEVYDPATNQWQTVAPMSTPRAALAAGVVDGKIYAIGGERGMSTVEVYDPATDMWRTAPKMPTGRAWLATAVVGRKIYAIGGHDGKKQLSTVEVFTPPRFSNSALSTSFSIDNRPAKITGITAKPQSLDADGQSSSEIHVTIESFTNQPVTDETVTLSTTLGTITPTASHIGNGIYAGTFTTGTTAGTATITATISNGKSKTVEITLKPQILSPVLSTLVADKEQIVADGVDEATVTISVKDISGKPAPDKPIKIVISGTENTIDQPQSRTNEKGLATVKIRSTAVEPKTVTATVGDEQIELNNSVTLRFINPVTGVSISAEKTQLRADVKSQSNLTITVDYVSGNTVREPKPTLDIAPNLGQLSQITDNGDSTYTATYTAPEDVAETTTVTVTVKVADKTHQVILSILNAEILITEISPPLIRVGERGTIRGELFPKIPTKIELTFRLGEYSITESTSSDANGTINHSFTRKRAGDWTVVANWAGDAKHKPVSSDPKNFTVAKAETAITLIPPDGLINLGVGDTMTLSGQIAPGFGIADLNIVITNPDDQKQTLLIQTDDSGNYQFQLTVDREGKWNIQVSFAGNEDYLHSQSTLDLEIGQQLGRAILVAGGPSRAEDNPLWPTTRYLSNFAYKTLQGRGYGGEMIRYLTPAPFEDVDGDGDNDASGAATVENLKKAITEWAMTFFRRHPKTQFILYITGHGFEDRFQLDDEREIVTANQIDQWLDMLQQQTRLSEILIIIDGSQSGSFVDELSANGRTIITSTDAHQTAIFVNEGRQSFSQFFLQHLSLGHSIGESFRLTEEAFVVMPEHLRSNPLLDSNDNGVTNEEVDRVLADQQIVGLDILPGTTIPMIDSVIPPQEIQDTKTALIWAEVRSVQGIQKVWSVIIPPNWEPKTADDRFELPVISLAQQADGKRYEGSYDGFESPGEYTAIIYAEDKAGNVSVPKQTSVTVKKSRSIEPTKSILTTWGELKTALLPNYPNPFNPETWIPYRLAKMAVVTIDISDVNGRRVSELLLGQKPAGEYVQKEEAAYWDGKDNKGQPVASGIYYYTLKAGNFTATRKMLLIK